MTSKTGPGLALYFTPGVTVRTWQRSGFLTREVAYYRSLSACVGPIHFLTTGHDDRSLQAALDPIGLLDNHWRLPQPVFDLTLPGRLARTVPRPAIVKTNQLAGTVGPILLKVVAGMKLVARGGYVASEPWWHRHRLHPRRFAASLNEALLCRLADLVLVTTSEGASYLSRRYRVPPGKIRVVPNFVEDERFSVDVPTVDGLITMVGRLTPQKNVLAAIEAVADLPTARLRIIGDGPLRAECESLARRRGVSVEFLGVVDHERLPRLLGESAVYLLASRYEGHPKSLIEAMAAARPCVATRAPGVSAVIRDGETGLLAEDASADALRRCLAAVLSDHELAAKLGAAARREALAKYSLDRVCALECDIYRAAGLLDAG